MKTSWTQTTLEEVCLKITDGAHNSPKSVECGLPMASVKDLTPHGINIETCRHISTKDFEKLVKQGCQPELGDVLIAKDGNSALDTVCEIKEKLNVVLLSSVAILRPNNDKIISSYLKYFLDSDTTRNYLKNGFITGAAIPRVVLKDFKRCQVSLPPLHTQQKIACILSAYDDLIENNTRRIQILEEMARSLYQEWFVKFRFPGHEQVKMVESELGLIPEGWQVSSFKKLFPKNKNIVLTGPFGSKLHAHDYREQGTPLVLVKHVKNGRIIDKDIPLVGQHKINELKRYKLCLGDIVVTRVGFVGESAYIHPQYVDWLFSGQMLRVRVPDSQIINSRFLAQYYLTESFKKTIENTAVGSTRLSLNTTILNESKFLLPAIKTQLAFVDLINPIDTIIQNLSIKNINLKKTRDLLLPKLISGQIDVENLDIDTGEIAA